MKRIFAMILCLMLAMYALSAQAETLPAEERLETYGNLNSFTAATLDGGSFTQDELKKYDLTIINFWSLMCGPCFEEMPDLAAFHKSLPENVNLIAVCLDSDIDPQSASDLMKASKFDGVTLTTGDGDFEKVCNAVLYTPTTLMFDSEGNIVGTAIIGGQTNLADAFTQAVNAALKAMNKPELPNEAK